MQEHEEEIIEEQPLQTILQAKGLLPCIYDGYELNPPTEFNTLTIQLDGTLRSDLNWKAAREKAEAAIAKGFALFWDIDLGLFSELTMPLDNQTQFLSLSLSLEHFRDHIWKDFSAHSIGLCIFRGQADFSHGFKWDDGQNANYQAWLQEQFPDTEINPELSGWLSSLFCRDVAVEYLAMLAARLPDTLPVYLFLDASAYAQKPLKQLQLLNPDRFDYLHLALKGMKMPFKALVWQDSALKEGPAGKDAQLGICLPLMHCYHPKQWEALDRPLKMLIDGGIPFRIISESHLITDWDGLDNLIYIPSGLSQQGKRKIQGFCAAGGCAISVEHLTGFSHEMTFDEWCN